MCAIIGSFNKNKMISLFELNAYRGELSNSISSFNNDGVVQNLNQYFGKFNEEHLNEHSEDMFYIGHSQAPTTNTNNIHPANIDNSLLWHNGIIKQKDLTENVWDTEWLLKKILQQGWSILSEIDGSFACVLYKENKLYIFRNEISPLFIDEDLNISSTKFEGSDSIESNTVFELNLYSKSITNIETFTTKENPYFFW